MMRAEAAPSVPDSMRSARDSATSIDSRSPESARSARSEPTKRDSSSRSSSMRAASAGACCSRLLRLGAQHEGVGLLAVAGRSAATSSDTPTSSGVLTRMPTTKPCPTGSRSDSGAGR